MATRNSVTAILSRIIEPERDDLTPEVAHFLLRLRFPEADLTRMDDLAAKARVGGLDVDEKEEIEHYEQVGDLLALVQSTARRSLIGENASV